MYCPCMSCSYIHWLRLISSVNAPAAHMGKVSGIGLIGIERHAVFSRAASVCSHQTSDRVKSCTRSQQ
jgi:hypothetical protein